MTPGGPKTPSKQPGRPSRQGKPKPRPKPLPEEMDAIVRHAWITGPTTTIDEQLLAIAKAVTKRVRGCQISVRKRDARKRRLPPGSYYMKTWDGTEWKIILFIPVCGGPDGEFDMFEHLSPASFRGEEETDNKYRKWLKKRRAIPPVELARLADDGNPNLPE